MVAVYRDMADRLADVVENLGVAALVVDSLGNVVLRNRAGRELVGAPATAPRNVWDTNNLTLWSADGVAVAREDYPARRLLRGLPVRNQEYLAETRDGRRLWLLVNGTTVPPNGPPELCVVTYQDVTDIHSTHETREDYFRAVSHDLRSPLNIISAQGQLLGRSLADRGFGAEARRALDIVRTAGRMSLMIDDLSESLRLESSQFQLRRHPTDICAVVKEVVDRMAVLGESRIDLSLPVEAIEVPADESRIERCVQNLVSNALRYSLPPSPVDVRVHFQDNSAIVDVEDRGPGISPEELPLIFQRFYRGKAGAGIEGLGLGLYVTRLLAEAHGGSVSVLSVPGKGCTFTLRVPAGPNGRNPSLH